MKGKKLFGKFNVVDIVVVVLVIAMIAVVAVKIFGSKATDIVAAKTTLYTEIEVIGAAPRLIEETGRQKDTLIGTRLVSGNEYMNATVEDIWFEDYYNDVQCADGSIVYSMSPDKKNIVFLIKTEVAEGTPSPKIGSQEVRSGRTFIIKTQTFETSGTIRYVNFGEYTK